ncbi:MAG: VOC family protein [Microlunatus sp.]|nr:VOC family protein [Microlunatus sp.]
MSVQLSGVVIDCGSPATLADFWQQVLGWPGRDDGERGEVILEPAAGTPAAAADQSLVFQPVAEPKTVKNRLHLDLWPDDQAAVVSRLEALGARRIDVGQGDDKSFVVLADPEGNEFCVLSG